MNLIDNSVCDASAVMSASEKNGLVLFLKKNYVLCSRLARCSTARGSGSGLFLRGPTKAKAYKSFLFTEVVRVCFFGSDAPPLLG